MLYRSRYRSWVTVMRYGSQHVLGDTTSGLQKESYHVSLKKYDKKTLRLQDNNNTIGTQEPNKGSYHVNLRSSTNPFLLDFSIFFFIFDV